MLFNKTIEIKRNYFKVTKFYKLRQRFAACLVNNRYNLLFNLC